MNDFKVSIETTGYIPISKTQIIYMKMLSDSTKHALLERKDRKKRTRKEMPAL